MATVSPPTPLGCAAANASLDLLEAEPDRYLGFEARHRSRLEVLARHPGIRRVRVTGTIAAFDLVVSDQEGYLNPAGKVLRRLARERGCTGAAPRPSGVSAYHLFASAMSSSITAIPFCRKRSTF